MTKSFKIRDFLKRIKNTIEIKDGVLYKRVTVSGNHNGVSLRDKVDGSKIGTKKQFTISGGNFILSKIDARNGAFGIIPNNLDEAIITGNFWTYKVDTELVDTEWFFYFTHSFNFIQICIESSTGSTHRKYLDEKVFLNHEIVLPSKTEQIEMVATYKEQSKISSNLKTEIKNQKQFLNKLNQSILQEGIQGILTENWRKSNTNIEPASELIKRIKADKNKLIKEKKIKKEKALPPILKEEIPLEIPNSWTWCRLGDILLYSDSGKSPNCKKIPAKVDEFGVLTTTSIQLNQFNEKANKVLPKDFKINNSHLVEVNDVLITRAGPVNRTGIACKVSNLSRKLILSDKTIRLKYSTNLINPDYLSSTLNSNVIRNLLLPKMTGMAKSQVNISQKNIKLTLFPLPPLEEQNEIIRKIRKLNTTSLALKKEVDKSDITVEILTQAVLKEAFETKGIKEVKVIDLPIKTTNVDYYKRTLLATEIVWQLQKELTLGHLKLQKLIYLAQESSTMQLPTNFLQQVAGPYDPKMARSLDKQMKTKKWFEYKKTELLKFKPLEKAGEHKTDFEKFFTNEKESIQYIIDTFKTAKSDSIELVGTLYACWKKLIVEKQIVTDNLLSKRFYEWSEEKAKFESNRIIKALRWMETKGIVPEKANA